MNLKNLEETVLTRGQIPVTVPFVRPRTYLLEDHQKRVVQHMKTHDRILVIHGTGSGKTLTSTYVALDFLKQAYGKHIVIFITPAAVHKQFVNSAATVLSGSRGVYFTTYDNLTRFFNKLFKSRRNTFSKIMKDALVIADEAHYITDKTEKARVFYDVLKHAKKVMLMTGTPIQNGKFTDLLPYAKILNPTMTIEPSDMSSFEHFFRCKVSIHQIPSTSSNFPRLLPTNRIPINLTNAQIQVVNNDRIKRYENMLWSGSRPTLKNKKMSGWAFNRSAYTYKVFGNTVEDPKFTEFLRIFRARPYKTIVFFVEYVTLNRFEKFLKEHNIYSVRITGREKNKAEIIKRSKPGSKIVYLLTKSAKEGLDFKGVRTLVFMDYPWVPSNYNQIVGRARRFQSHIALNTANRNVKIYELAYRHGSKQTLNMRSLNILTTKRAQIANIMQRLESVSIESQTCVPSQQTVIQQLATAAAAPGTSRGGAAAQRALATAIAAAATAPPRPRATSTPSPNKLLRARSLSPGKRRAPLRTRSVSPKGIQTFLRRNRVLSSNGKYAINPANGKKYHLENLNIALNQPIIVPKVKNNMGIGQLMIERKAPTTKTTKKSAKTARFSPKGGYGIERLFTERPKTARFSPKRGGYGIERLFNNNQPATVTRSTAASASSAKKRKRGHP